MKTGDRMLWCRPDGQNRDVEVLSFDAKFAYVQYGDTSFRVRLAELHPYDRPAPPSRFAKVPPPVRTPRRKPDG